MSNVNLRRSALAVVLAALALAIAPGAASAASVAADLRVQTPTRTLADQRQLTDTVRIRANPGALCFGKGSGGSGNTITLNGPTALGIVKDATASARRLRPVLVTDAFGFGLGVCGFGTAVASGSASWYLKVNHAGAQMAGDRIGIRHGDQVLWYLAPSFPYPAELELRAPPRVMPGVSFTVTAFAYADDGTRTPAAGAAILGKVTDANGRATLTRSSAGKVTLQATRGTDIASNKVRVCVGDDCAEQGKSIAGTRGPDRIKGTPRPDTIQALGGDDRIDVRRGGRDVVNCGGGRGDRVRANRRDRVRNCERVIRG
jgi:hypothetical protein